MTKVDSRTLSIPALNERRRLAVKLRIGGMKLADVAAATDLRVATIIEATKRFHQGGWAAVNVGERGRKVGDGRKLSVDQEKRIQALIRDKTPDQLKLSFALWNRVAIGLLIELEFGVKLPVRTVGHYLKRWGYTPQKPIRKAYEQRPEAVKLWLTQAYPAIAKRAKEENGEVYWGDETGLRTDDVRGRSYSPQGVTPIIRVHRGKRENLSMISAVTNRGVLRWMVLEEALNAERLIEFFERLIRDAGRKVFLIVDNLPVHHAKVVKAWLAERTNQIEVFYLPSYSPELNPDEYLNADLKGAVRAKPASKGKGELRKVVDQHLAVLTAEPERVKKFFHHPCVRYAA